MSTFRVNIPVEVSVETEVDTKEFQRRFTQLLYSSWEGGPSSRCPATENFLVSTRHFMVEVATWAVSAKSELDLDAARELVLGAHLTVNCGASDE